MNSLPTDHSSSPEHKGKAAGLLILSCPSCGHRLRLAHQHLGVEGNCVSCHTRIMGVEVAPGRFEAVKTSPTEAQIAGFRQGALGFREEVPKGSSRKLPFGPPSMADGFFNQAPPKSPVPMPTGSPFGPGLAKPREFGATPPKDVPQPEMADREKIGTPPETTKPIATEPPRTASSLDAPVPAKTVVQPEVPLFGPSPFFGLPPQTVSFFAPEPSKTAELPDKVVSALAEIQLGCAAQPTEFGPLPLTATLFASEPAQTTEKPTLAASPFLPTVAKSTEFSPSSFTAPLFTPKPAQAAEQPDKVVSALAEINPGCAAQPTEFGPPPLTDDLFASKPAKIVADQEVANLNAASPFFPVAAKSAELELSPFTPPLFAPGPAQKVVSALAETSPNPCATPFLPVATQPTEFGPPPLTGDLFAPEPAKPLAESEVTSLQHSITPSLHHSVEANSFFSGTIFEPSTGSDQPSPAPQIAPVQTLSQASVSLFGESLAASAQPVGVSPFFAIPGDGMVEQSIAKAPSQDLSQGDLLGPPVKDDAPAASQSPVAEFAKNSDVRSSVSVTQPKNPFVVNLTSSDHSATSRKNNPPAIPAFVPGIGTSVGTASLNSHDEALSRGLDEVIPKKLEARVTSATPAQEALAPENRTAFEPVVLPKIILPKIEQPIDNFSTSRILAVLFICSVFGGFGAYLLTPYEKREQIKSQLVDWLEPGSVVIENLPFGQGKRL